jgi:hypothetical protein
VEAEIRISGSDGNAIDEVREFAGLLSWLRAERGLPGAIREVRSPTAPGQLGGAVEVLTVALGASGAAGTLATALFGWLRTRRPNVKITVTQGSRSVVIEASRVRDADLVSLVREVLEASDGH